MAGWPYSQFRASTVRSRNGAACRGAADHGERRSLASYFCRARDRCRERGSVIAAALPATASAAVPSTSKDYALIARDIIPSGQTEDVPATQPRDRQQAQMYDALTPLFNHVTASDVTTDFKPETGRCRALSGPIDNRDRAACRRDDAARRLRRAAHLRHDP